MSKENVVYSSPAEEQTAFFDELMAALKAQPRSSTRIIRITNLHHQNWGQCLLFRTFLANTVTKHDLTFIEEAHRILIEYGTAEPHTLLNETALDAASAVMKATGNYFLPWRSREGSGPVREYINYVLTSGNYDVLVRIIAERRPKTTEQLKALEYEFQKSAVPLQSGAL